MLHLNQILRVYIRTPTAKFCLLFTNNTFPLNMITSLMRSESRGLSLRAREMEDYFPGLMTRVLNLEIWDVATTWVIPSDAIFSVLFLAN